MATKTDNPTTAAATSSAENSLRITPAAVPPSTKSDQVENSTAVINEGAKKQNHDPKSSSSVSSLTGKPASVSDTEKKIRRAERFGITVQLSEQEKRNSRAERFGTGPTMHSSDSSKKSEELKRKARAERFGIPASPVTSDEESKKKARLERFAPAPKTDALEEDKRKARAIRFSQPSSDSLSINGKGSVEPNAAIVGKASGGS